MALSQKVLAKISKRKMHESNADPPKGFQSLPLWTYEVRDVGLHHLSMSPTAQEIAVSQWDGTIQILSARTGRISYTIPFVDTSTVVSCSKFHPSNEKKLLLSCGTSGHVALCQYQKGQFIWSTQELDTNTYTCDFSCDGDTFATAGKDSVVRIYHTETRKLVTTFSKQDADPCHTARIYSLVFDNNNPHVLVTGGWDTRVILWDTRQTESVAHFGGPNICGDSIDVRDTYLLTGAWRSEWPLELWDMRSPGEPLARGNWGGSEFCQIYSAKFCQMEGWIAAGGSESHSMKVFSCPEFNGMARLGYFDKAVNSVVVAPDGRLVVAASQDGKCCAFENHK